MEIPDEFIEWATLYASSNVELATLSNINRHWRRVVIRVLLEQANDEENQDRSTLLLLPSMLRHVATNNTTNMTFPLETFCAAWFPPAGIQYQRFEGGNNIWQQQQQEESPPSFAPSGASLLEASEEEQPRARGRSLLRNSSQEASGPLCSHEWQGYREPFQVLEPFGYAKHFVQAVLSGAQPPDNHREANGRAQDEAHANSILADAPRTNLRVTVGVRGATLARPEGYCLCWDSSDVVACASANNEDTSGTRQDGYLRSIMARKRRRQILQREVLPRVLLSSQHKNPLFPGKKNKQQPCLQFLNASGSNAVRLFTPPFQCGPLQGPITLFLVGIATEDGVFISGLNRRCELGHMHPLNMHDAMIDMSPVCIATDNRYPQQQRSGSPSESLLAAGSRSLASGRSGDSLGQDDSDDSSCAVNTSGEEGMQCNCEFNQVNTQSWDDQDEQDPPEECIYRGQRGPGLWHCYVCVFDRQESVIRIDGATEPLEKGRCGELPPAPAVLDGLTIGSDHCFDMSLGLGDASIEEGEGAISEVAVFKGRMADADIEQLEDYLMRKHGIAKPTSTERTTLVCRDQWKRQGRALIAQPPPWSMRATSGIPLPIMAQDRDVSWHRINAVTGKDVRVSRIGSKFSHGSSDW